jgi:hypothetical protein
MEGVSKFLTLDMEDVVMFHKKSVSNLGFSFILAFQMRVTTKANLPILTSNHIFPNGEGLERLAKCVPKKKSISEEVHNFQNTQEKNVQIVAPFEAQKKKNNLITRLHPKKGGDG